MPLIFRTPRWSAHGSTQQVTILSKIRTVAWFLRRPQLIPELIRQIGIALKGRAEYRRADAERFCRLNAISVSSFLDGAVPGWAENPSENRELADLISQAQESTAHLSVHMGGGANMELLFFLARNLGATKVLETGVALGWSSLAILAGLRGRHGAQLVSVDMPYVKRGNESDVGAAVPPELHENWKLIRLADREGIPRALRYLGRLDLAHYDSDKTPEGRMFAYPALWSALTPGGYLVSDDVSDNMAFLQFAQSVGVEPIIVGVEGKYVGIIQRLGRAENKQS
jgi:predicted O-methyltransferase YrrM